MVNHPSVGLARSIKAAVVRNGIQEVFARRLKRIGKSARRVVITSPWITSDDASAGAIPEIAKTIEIYRIPTYIFTRRPESASHHRAIDLFASFTGVEIVYNQHLHAKIFACLAPHPYGFAILGSANLTTHSSVQHEIGIQISAVGGGEELIKELAGFGLDYLRTRPESTVVKKISPRRLTK